MRCGRGGLHLQRGPAWLPLLDGKSGDRPACPDAGKRGGGGVHGILGKNGVEKIVELELNADEKAKFAASAAAVHKTNAALKEVGAL